MIFKTFNNDIDKWTAKIGVFGKSFNELGTAINNAFETSINNIDNFDENIGFWETLKDNLAPKNENGDSWLRNSLGEIISAENINAYIAELDLTSAKNKLTEIFDWEANIKNGDATWQDYFDTLQDGSEHYIPDLIKNTNDLSKLTGDDLVNANQAARSSALAHNKALKQQTFGAKAASVAMSALSTVANMVLMYAITKLITAWDDYKESLHEAAQETAEQAEKSSNHVQSLLDLKEQLDEGTTSAEDLTIAFREQMRTMGYTEEEIDNLIDKYNGLAGAIKGATEEALNNAKTDAYADISTSGQSLMVEAKGNTNVGINFGTTAQERKLSEKVKKMLEDSPAILDGGVYRMDKNASAEDIYSYYLTLKDISRLIQETAKETGDDSLLTGDSMNPTPYYQVSEALDSLSESAELYGDAVSRLHNADAQLELSNYLKTNDIDSKETFDAYIDGIKNNTTYSEAYKQVLLEVANDAFPQFSAAAKDANDSMPDFTNELTDSRQKMISELNDMSEGFEELQKIYESISNTEPFDFKLLDNDNFKEAFSGLGDVYTDFVEQVASTPNDINACQSAFDNLVTEWMKSLNILEGVTEENANLTVQMLEQMGVANAEQIVNQMFTIVSEESQILNDAEAEFLATYQNYLVSKDEADLNYLESSASKNGQLISALGEGYQQDYKNWCDLLSKKAEAYNELVKAVGGSYNSAVSTVDNLMANGVTPTMSSITAAEAAKGQYQMLTEAANKAKNSLKLDLSQIKTSFGSSYKPSGALGGGSSSSAKETVETYDWIERAIQKVQRTITNLGKTVSSTYKTWATRNDALKRQISSITDEISVQQKAYDYYMKKASSLGLSSSYISKIQNGTINIETIKDEKLIEKIKKYQELYDQANDAQDAIQDLHDELADLARQRFDNISQEYKNQISSIEHEINMLESYIDQTEARGYLVSTKYYSSLADTERKNIKLLEAEYNSLTSALSEAMDVGKIEVYSEEWYDMMSEIQGVEEALVEANTALIEYNNSLRELEWERFNKGQEMISDLIAESEFLRDLIGDEKLFDEKGNTTEFGDATFGLHAVDYNTYMSQADDYAREILRLNEEIANDPNNQLMLDRRRELIESHREMILSAEDEKQAMKDLVSDGYDAMLNYMSELIEKRKDAINEIKNLADYEKTVTEQTQTVSELKKIQQSLIGDTSESGRLALQQNTEELRQAEESLQETMYEKYISDQEQMLDTIYSDTEQWVNARLDDLNGLVQGVIDSTNENSDSIRETFETETEKVGYTLSDEMQNIWSGTDGIKNVVSMYGNDFNTNVTTVNNTLLGIKSLLESMVNKSDKDVSDNITESTKPSTSTPSTPTTTPMPSTPSTTSSSSAGTIKVGGKINAGSAKIYDYAGDTSGERQLFRNDPYYIVLDERNNYLKVRHHSLKSGVTGWFKKSDVKAYKTGGLVDYTGLAWVDGQKKKPEAFLNAQDTENISELKDTLIEVDASQLKLLTMEQIREFTSSIDELKPIVESMVKRPDFTPMTNNQNFEVNFDITMHGVNDPQTFAQQIKEVYSNNTRNLRSMLQTDMFSKNSFEHRKYM